MKPVKRYLLAALVGFCFSPYLYATQSYIIEPTHSYVGYHIDHFGFSYPSGKWPVQGKIEFDKDNLQNSKVSISINVAEVVTGSEKLDKHLRSDTFFNVEKFPTATFVSDTIESNDNKNAQVHGTLTVHGVSTALTLDIRLNKVAVSPVTNKQTIGFSGKATLKRSELGLNAYLPGLGDEVKLEIETEANKAH